ncbi:unnamed protein product [Symbiodinium sp. CCMP2592]|nr:unnamed protein product [Symbiodinium sp. CCMP2592]
MGAKPLPTDLSQTTATVAAARAVAGWQSNKRVLPLVPEFKHVVNVRGSFPAASMQGLQVGCKLPASWEVPASASVDPCFVSSVPQGSKILRILTVPGEMSEDAPDNLSAAQAGRVLPSLSAPPEDAHPAEKLACIMLQWNTRFSQEEMRTLLDMLPQKHQTRARGSCDEQSNQFLCGAYAHGPMTGCKNLTRDMPWCTAVLCKHVRDNAPGFCFSAVGYLCNVRAEAHRDLHNEPGTKNLVMATHDCAGGGLWLEEAGGPVAMVVDKTQRAGRFHDLAVGRPFIFEPKRWHATQPWRGDRGVIVAYTPVGVTKLATADKGFLENLGFPLGPSSGSSDVPPRVAKVQKGSIVFGVYHEPEEFVARALSVQHPCHLESLLPSELVEAIRANHSKDVATLGRERTEMLKKWLARAEELETAEKQLKGSFSSHRRQVLCNKRLLLMKEMLDSVGHEDEDLISDLSNGFDLTGPLPRSNAFKNKYRPAAMAEETLRKSAGLVRGQVLASVKSSGDEIVDRGVLAATEKELSKGFIEGPVSASDIPADGTVTHRFGVIQGETEEGPKVRPIDNYLSSLVNSVVSQSEQVPVHTLDVVAGMLAMWLHLSPLKSLREGLVCKCWDLSAAYKQLPLSDKSFEKDSFFVIYCPRTRKHVIYKQRVMPFGAKASVTAFIRCAFGIWRLGVKMFALVWSFYFDDFLSACKPEERRHVEVVISTLFRILGWDLSLDKLLPYDVCCKVLGIKIDMAEARLGLFKLANTEKRVMELTAALDEVLLAERLSHSDCEKLRGRLQFASGQLFGRRAKVALHQLSRHHGGRLSEATSKACRFLRRLVSSNQSRLISRQLGNVVHVYVDASFSDEGKLCGIGGMAYDHKGSLLQWFGENLDASLVSQVMTSFERVKETVIFELEALAVHVALKCFFKALKGKNVVVFTDNEGVHGAFVKCWTVSQFATHVIDAVCEIEESLGFMIWYDRVPSASNPSDPLSRGVWNLPTPLSPRVSESAVPEAPASPTSFAASLFAEFQNSPVTPPEEIAIPGAGVEPEGRQSKAGARSLARQDSPDSPVEQGTYAWRGRVAPIGPPAPMPTSSSAPLAVESIRDQVASESDDENWGNWKPTEGSQTMAASSHEDVMVDRISQLVGFGEKASARRQKVVATARGVQQPITPPKTTTSAPVTPPKAMPASTPKTPPKSPPKSPPKAAPAPPNIWTAPPPPRAAPKAAAPKVPKAAVEGSESSYSKAAEGHDYNNAGSFDNAGPCGNAGSCDIAGARMGFLGQREVTDFAQAAARAKASAQAKAASTRMPSPPPAPKVENTPPPPLVPMQAPVMDMRYHPYPPPISGVGQAYFDTETYLCAGSGGTTKLGTYYDADGTTKLGSYHSTLANGTASSRGAIAEEGAATGVERGTQGNHEGNLSKAVTTLWQKFPPEVQKELSEAGFQAGRQPSPPPGLQSGKGKGAKGGLDEQAEASKNLWDSASDDQKKLMRQAGIPEPVASEPTDLAALCKKHLESLPPSIQQALAALDPPAPTQTQQIEIATRRFKQSTTDLRQMIQQTAALQIRIDRAKATYQELLEKMKVCQSDLQSKQAEVTAMQSELEATLRADALGLEDPARKDDPLEGLLDTLAKVGIVLTQEQKELYEEAQRGKLNDGQQNMEVEATNQPGLTAPTSAPLSQTLPEHKGTVPVTGASSISAFVATTSATASQVEEFPRLQASGSHAEVEQGSLGWWLCQEILALQRSFDLTLLLLVARGFEVLRKSQPQGHRQMRVTSCNITSWRPEVKQWFSAQGDVILIQEHHLLESQVVAEISSMAAMGFDSFLVPAAPGEGQYTNQGCGYVAVTLRTQGADLTVVSLYLQSSSGFGSPVNSDILASLRAIRQSVRGPILIGGDWNSPLKELLDTAIFQSLSLEPIGPNEATCGDNELDFLAVSHCLEGLLRVDASWDVPFKPHAAIQVALNVGAFQLTTPQLPSFVLSFREEPLDYMQVEETLASLPDTTLSADPLSNRLASISSSVEHSLLQTSQGIGRQLQVEFLPAVPRMSQFAWEGSCQAFWHRVQFLCQGDHPKRREQCQEYLPQILDHWQGNSEEAVSFLSTLQACLSEQAAVPEPVQQLLQEQFLLASKVHQDAQTKSYRSWLQGAQEKGMAPLFKTIKKGEITTARPFRDLSAEVRALARTKLWLRTWKGVLRVEDLPPLPHAEQQARGKLRELAAQQVATLSPISPEQLQQRFSKGRVTAPGPDGWSKSLLKKLTWPMLQDIAEFYQELERGLRVPQQFLLTQVCMLPKSATAERPISLTHVLWRDYCRARWSLIQEWTVSYQALAPWDAAVPGRTSLDIGIRRLLWAEASRTQSKHFVGLFLDIKGFYDCVVWASVVDTGLLLQFPPLLLELSLQIYGGDLQATGLTHNIDQWLDDISADVVSLEKTKFLCSDSATSQVLERLRSDQAQAKLAKTAQQGAQAESCQQWLFGALSAGMEPVYRALKSHKQTLVRPFRDQSALVRAYCRMEFWSRIWDASIVPPQLHLSAERLALRAEALQQAQDLSSLSWEQVKTACLATGNKKGGLDGWSYKALRNLPDFCYRQLAGLFRLVETDLTLPLQMLTVQVALLAKTPEKERPISLTSVLWRVYSKLRRPLLESWLKEYAAFAPFDSATPGHTSLDPALSRLIKAEDHKFRKVTFITLFVDLEGFYDGVDFSRLISQGKALSFPPLLLELSLQLYNGKLEALLSVEKLRINKTKTKFVVNSAKAAKALNSMRVEGDPQVADLVRDLGLDSAGAKRRRVTHALKRFKVGRARNQKLHQLGTGCKAHRLYATSILTAEIYGCQGQGLSPKRLKVVRASISRHVGRSKWGSVDVSLDCMSFRCQDPLLTVVLAQADALYKMFGPSTAQGWEILARTWKVAWTRQEAAVHGWKCVAGPVAAMVQYCIDLRINVSDPLRWVHSSGVLLLDVTNPGLFLSVRRFLTQVVALERASRFGAVPTAQGAQQGVDWSVHRKLLKVSKPSSPRWAFHAVWQGRTLHAGNGPKGLDDPAGFGLSFGNQGDRAVLSPAGGCHRATTGNFDLTGDCKPALKALAFEAEFPGQLWRRELNAKADTLAGLKELRVFPLQVFFRLLVLLPLHRLPVPAPPRLRLARLLRHRWAPERRLKGPAMPPKTPGRQLPTQLAREQAGLSWKSSGTLERQRARKKNKRKKAKGLALTQLPQYLGGVPASMDLIYTLFYLVAYCSQTFSVKDLGSYNWAVFPRRGSEAPYVCFVDAADWVPLTPDQRAVWPNRYKAQGLWTLVRHNQPDNVEALQQLTNNASPTYVMEALRTLISPEYQVPLKSRSLWTS